MLMSQELTSQNPKDREVALARLFSPSIFKDIATRGKSSAFSRLAEQCGIFSQGSIGNVADAFDFAFRELKRGNRSEYIYKAVLAQKTVLGVHNLNTATLLSEFRAGSSKADIVVVNGTTTVYEVKSERDKLSRLPSQISDYLKVFGKVNVIVAEKHIEYAEKALPEIVGILSLTKRNQISTIRQGLDNSSNVQSLSIFNSLSLNEASKVLVELGIRVPVVPNTQMYSELAKIFEDLPGKVVHEASVKVLRGSRSQTHLRDFLAELPQSLKVSALTTPVRVRDRSRVLKTLDLPIETAKKWI